MQPSDHEQFMRRAIALSARSPFPFAAVLVQTVARTILAEGWNRGMENPIWHGEIDVINRCAAAHANLDWGSLTLYTTAEPCPMCQSAILWAGIGTVVFGSSIETLKSRGWQQIDISAAEVVRRTAFRHCELVGGVLEAECDALFAAAPEHYRVTQSAASSQSTPFHVP